MARSEPSRARLAGAEGSFAAGTALLDVGDVAATLGLGRSFVYLECERGRLQHLRFGRRVKIPEAALHAYMRAAAERGVGVR